MKRTWKEFIHLYLKLITASIKSRMEYRATFLIFLFTIITFYTAQIFTIGIVINKFQKIGGWNMGEMAFLYSLLILSQSIVSFGLSGILDFSNMVRDGSYDRMLIRPLSPLGQVIANGFELSGIAHIILGIMTFLFANSMIEIQWTFLNILLLLSVILGGASILAGIRIFISAVAFYAINNQSLVHLFVFSSKEFLLYPLNIYNFGIRFILTFIFPLAFINFYPAHLFLNKTGDYLFHPYIIYISLPVGLFTLFLSLWFWEKGQTAYESAGA